MNMSIATRSKPREPQLDIQSRGICISPLGTPLKRFFCLWSNLILLLDRLPIPHPTVWELSGFIGNPSSSSPFFPGIHFHNVSNYETSTAYSICIYRLYWLQGGKIMYSTLTVKTEKKNNSGSTGHRVNWNESCHFSGAMTVSV